MEESDFRKTMEDMDMGRDGYSIYSANDTFRAANLAVIPCRRGADHIDHVYAVVAMAGSDILVIRTVPAVYAVRTQGKKNLGNIVILELLLPLLQKKHHQPYAMVCAPSSRQLKKYKVFVLPGINRATFLCCR